LVVNAFDNLPINVSTTANDPGVNVSAVVSSAANDVTKKCSASKEHGANVAGAADAVAAASNTSACKDGAKHFNAAAERASDNCVIAPAASNTSASDDNEKLFNVATKHASVDNVISAAAANERASDNGVIIFYATNECTYDNWNTPPKHWRISFLRRQRTRANECTSNDGVKSSQHAFINCAAFNTKIHNNKPRA
jgi:hypothetical protein